MRCTSAFVVVCVVVGVVADDRIESATETPAVEARRAVEGYVSAALAGKVPDAAALAVEGQSPARKDRIDEFRVLVAVKELKVMTVFASEKAGQATAVSEPVKVAKANPDGRNTGVMSFKLVRTNGQWLIKDVDFDTEAKAKTKVEAFRKQNPDAKEAPAK